MPLQGYMLFLRASSAAAAAFRIRDNGNHIKHFAKGSAPIVTAPRIQGLCLVGLRPRDKQAVTDTIRAPTTRAETYCSTRQGRVLWRDLYWQGVSHLQRGERLRLRHLSR